MIEFVLKASLALLIFYTFYIAFLAKERMFAFNRFYLLFALGFSMLVPLLSIPVNLPFEKTFFTEEPGETVSTLEINQAGETTPHSTALPFSDDVNQKSNPVISPINWIFVGLGIYFLGLILCLIRLFLRIGKIIQIIRNHPKIKAEGFKYVLLPYQILPYTFLNYLFVDQQAFEGKNLEKEVIHHELTHIRQRHTWDVFFIELFIIVFWFNPLLVLYKKAIQLNHEFLADEAVNVEFRDKITYQILLFQKVKSSKTPLSISSPFNASMTKRRIIMMGKPSSLFKVNLYKSFSLVLTVMALFFLSSNKPYYSVQTYPGAENDFEKLLAQGFLKEKPYQLELAKLDLQALRKSYLSMDEEAKNKATEFPFFDRETFKEMKALQQTYPKIKTTILFDTPPEKKQIPNDVYLEWKNTQNIILTIDEIEVDNHELNNHLPSDFAFFTVRETEEKKLFKKSTYQISLYTHDYFMDNNSKKRKRIMEIRSKYPDSTNVSVFYPQKHFTSYDTLDLNSEEYKASIFYQLRTLDPKIFDGGFNNPPYIKKPESFRIAVYSEGKPTFFTNLPLLK